MLVAVVHRTLIAAAVILTAASHRLAHSEPEMPGRFGQIARRDGTETSEGTGGHGELGIQRGRVHRGDRDQAMPIGGTTSRRWTFSLATPCQRHLPRRCRVESARPCEIRPARGRQGMRLRRSGGVLKWATSSSTAFRWSSSVCVFSTFGQPTSCRRVPRRMAEYIIVGAIAAGVMVYLAYALLFPEKF